MSKDYQLISPDDGDSSVADSVEEKKETGWKERVIGLVIVLLIIATWVSSAEAGNLTETDAQYNKTFFIVYVNNVWNIFILPIYLVCYYGAKLVTQCCHKKPKLAEGEYAFHYEDGDSGAKSWAGSPATVIREALKEAKMSVWKLMLASAVATFNLVVADYLYFWALSKTSAGSGVVIFNLASIIVYVLSIFLLGESFSVIKIASVVLSFGGVVMVSIGDFAIGDERWIGDVVMAGGAVFWALYLVFYKKLIGEPNLTVVNIQGTIVGLMSTFLLWFIVPILDVTHWEPFQLPDATQFKFLLVTSALVFANNYMFSTGAAMTTPLFVAIGGMLAIPVSSLIDYFWRDTPFTILKIVGSVVVAVGFILVNLPSDTFSRMVACCRKKPHKSVL